jgi:uncharacterized OB-fold protein
VSAAHPRPDPAGVDDVRFWSYIAARQLRIQRCVACGRYRHPPRPMCPACGSDRVDWVVSSGRGEVWARTVIHPPTLPAFASRTPYGAVVVRLDEGVFLVSNVIDRDADDVAVGMAVQVEITEVEADLHLPLFRTPGETRSESC